MSTKEAIRDSIKELSREDSISPAATMSTLREIAKALDLDEKYLDRLKERSGNNFKALTKIGEDEVEAYIKNPHKEDRALELADAVVDFFGRGVELDKRLAEIKSEEKKKKSDASDSKGSKGSKSNKKTSDAPKATVKLRDGTKLEVVRMTKTLVFAKKAGGRGVPRKIAMATLKKDGKNFVQRKDD